MRAVRLAGDHRLGRPPQIPRQSRREHGHRTTGTDRDQLGKILTVLAEGGQLKGKLTKQACGGEAGYVKDKFAINWVVSIHAD